MSLPPPSGINEETLLKGEHGVMAEPDHKASRAVALIGLVSILCFIIASGWAWLIFIESRKTYAPDGLPEIPSLITERTYEIGIVNQWEFGVDQRAPVLHRQRETQLSAFGWVDRPQERIHVPVQTAYAEVISEKGLSPIAPAAIEGTEPAPGDDVDEGADAPTDAAPTTPAEPDTTPDAPGGEE